MAFFASASCSRPAVGRRLQLSTRVARMFAAGPPVCAGLAVCAALAASALAQMTTAQLTSIFPPGGKQGAAVELKIAGADLDEAARLVFSHAGIKAEPKLSPATPVMPAKPIANEFVVTIGGDVPAGVYECRVVGRFGVSNPRGFAVGTSEEALDNGANRSFAQAQEAKVGQIINGRMEAAGADHYRLALTKGQRVIIDCHAGRLDSLMSGVLVLFDANQNELARNRGYLGNDPLLDFTAPADGQYTVALQDFLYRGGAEHVYRLRAHSGPHIDFVFPPAGPAGAAGQYTLYGRNLPGGKPSSTRVGGLPLEELAVTINLPADPLSQPAPPQPFLVEARSVLVDGFEYRLSSPQGDSNPAAIGYAVGPITVEAEPNNTPDKAQKVAVPGEYAGKFYPDRDDDWLEFDAKKGDVLLIDLISHRLGLESDPLMVIKKVNKNAQGEVTLADVAVVDDPADRAALYGSDFDTSTDDPSHRLVVAEDATYRVMARDQFGSGRQDPRMVYRLAIRREQPDFRLTAFPFPDRKSDQNKVDYSTGSVRRGGTALFQIRVDRRDGFEGEIEIVAEGLPAGVSSPGAIAGGKVNEAWLVVSAEENAAPWSGPIRVIGKARVDGKDVVRPARGGSIVWGSANRQAQPPVYRATRDIVLSVVEKETAPAFVFPAEQKVFETSLGGTVSIPIKQVRRGEFKADLAMNVVGAPGQMKPAAVALKGDGADGKLDLVFNNLQFPPGAYTMYLQGDAKVKYVRNPDALKAAEDEQKRLDEVVKQLAEALKQANQKRDQGAADATKAAAELAQSQQAQQAAQKAAQDAAAAVAAAEQKLAAAKKDAEANAGDQGKADAAKAVEKEVEAAKQKATEAQTKAADAAKAFEAATQKNADAQKLKTETDQAAKDADAMSKQATAMKTAADQAANAAKQANAPKDATFGVVSLPVRVRLDAAPFRVKFPQPTVSLKAGEKTEGAIAVDRLYGFDDKVDITAFEPPGTVAGLTLKMASVAKGQGEAKFEIATTDKTPPGEYVIGVKTRAAFGGLNLDKRDTFVLKVAAP